MMITAIGTDHETVDLRQFDRADLAWAAGFIDGDGMISFFNRSDRRGEYYVKMTAVNTDLEPLEKLQLMFGGSINTLFKMDNRYNWAPSWAWIVSHRKAERVLRVIGSFLVAKHKQAMLALEARTLIGDRRRKRDAATLARLASIETQFRALNKKGK